MSYGWKMPEESVGAILRSGLAEVRASFEDDDAIDELLGRIYANVADSRRADIKAWLAEHEPQIFFAYPHDHKLTPCWAIVIDPKQQVQNYIGDDDGDEELETGEFVAISAERWTATVGVITYAENADLVRWLDQLATFLLARGRQSLADDYKHGQRLSGRDLQPDHVGGENGRLCFRRVLTVELEFDQTDATRFAVSDDITNAVSLATAGSPLDDELEFTA